MDKQTVANGYDVPLHRSLTEKILLAGAPREIVLMNCGLLVMFIFILHFLYIIPFCLAIHLAAVYTTKYDAQFFDCFLAYLKTKKYYSA